MNGINAFLIGRAGHDPEMQYLPDSGDAVVRLSVAVRDFVQNEEVTYWVRAQFYGRTAEHVNQYVHKGARIAVSGRLRPENYTRRDGTPGFGLRMICNQQPQIIDWPTEGGGDNNAAATSAAGAAAGDADGDIDDLPF